MAHMDRSEFDALSAVDARAKADNEPDETLRRAWLQLADEIDKVGPEATAADLTQEMGGRLYKATESVYADITPDLLSRSMRDPDLTKAREARESGADEAGADS
jgi:hypothetical protein